MKHFLVVIVGTVLLIALEPAASRGGTTGVEVKTVTYELERGMSAEHLDAAIRMTSLDLDWLPLEVEAGRIVTEGNIELKHYLKVEITYDAKRMIIKPLEIGESIDLGKCVPFGRRTYRRVEEVPCVHRNYYVWLEQIAVRLPKSAEKIELIRSLCASSS